MLSVISLWQPWAQWIALGWKTIETRTHNRFIGLVGERIGIHAAKKWDRLAFNAAYRYMSYEQKMAFYEMSKSDGGLLCTTYIFGFSSVLTEKHSAQALTQCGSGMSGLFLKDIKRLKKPLRIPGRQGIFYIPNDRYEEV